MKYSTLTRILMKGPTHTHPKKNTSPSPKTAASNMLRTQGISNAQLSSPTLFRKIKKQTLETPASSSEKEIPAAVPTFASLPYFNVTVC